ncbi:MULTISPECIES: hypothetical protein [unclassified Sphingomonas]|uniref:hypothetical protein n=1 Tax=unclassified Sphingomonas TaxID=196159 RepID=UPI0021508117|nr:MULTISPECIES: hypothetical protein [unclassified Sphingomonas]MCR5869774.1 hypothetical protein [Sphingomonas sp. J344]UUX98520.1 hypothetical protein LRS08_13280 [Sphingomonas sp. J315]
MQGEDTYRLEVDRERKLVILTVFSMLGPEDSSWAGEELRAGIQTFGPDIGKHATLYDMSAVPGMPTATIDRTLATLDHPAVRKIWARKIAFVVTTATARMQVTRLQKLRPDIAMFDTRESAVAWLVAP